MSTFPHCLRSIATSAVFASALSLAFTGCSNKISPASSTANPASSQTSLPATSPAAASASLPAPALTLPRGTRLQVRLNQTINVKHVESGDRFTGSLAEPVVEGNVVAVPAGSAATGEVLVAHKRGLFKGRSMMALTLTRLDVNGTTYRVDTSSLSRSKKGKGRRSAAFIGGGAGMGMLIGGVATGGVGLLVGGLAGGGAGALGAAFTGNRDLSIPAESVVTFRLQNDLILQPDTTQANLAH
jgi:hypothetical protein